MHNVEPARRVPWRPCTHSHFWIFLGHQRNSRWRIQTWVEKFQDSIQSRCSSQGTKSGNRDSQLTCWHVSTCRLSQRTGFFLKHDSWPGPPALHPLCLETTQTGGLGEAGALNVLTGLLETAEALKRFHEGLLKDRGRLFVCYWAFRLFGFKLTLFALNCWF